jgi:hypothetical protein
MDRRKILWYPVNGIDATREVGNEQLIDFCASAKNVCAYEDNVVRSRSAVVSTGIFLEGSTEILQAEQVASLGGSLAATITYILTDYGIYRDGTLIAVYTGAISPRIAVWRNIIVFSGSESVEGTYLLYDPQDGSAATTKALGAPVLTDEYLPRLWLTREEESGYSIWNYIATASFDGVDTITLDDPVTTTWSIGMKVAIQYSITETNYTSIGEITDVVSNTIYTVENWENGRYPLSLTDLTVYAGFVQLLGRAELELEVPTLLYSGAPPVYQAKIFYYKVQYRNSVFGTTSNTYTVGPLSSISPTCSPVVQRIPIDWGDYSYYDGDFDTIRVFRYDPRVTTEQVYRLVYEGLIEDMDQYIDGSTGIYYTDYEDDYPLILGTEEVWVEDRNYPPVNDDGDTIGFGYIIFYANRLWGVYGNRVYYSEPYDTTSAFEYYGPTGLNYFEFNDDPVVLVDGVTSLYVVCSSSIYVLGGTNPDSMTQRRVVDKVGAWDEDSVCYHSGTLYSISSDGKISVLFGSSQAWMTKVNALTTYAGTTDRKVILTPDNDLLWISVKDGSPS